MIGLRIALAAAVLLAAVPSMSAQAAPLVGRAVVGGKAVELFEDGTWKYAAPVQPGCAVVQDRLSFCGSMRSYKPMRIGISDFAALFSHGDRQSAGYIYEGVGAQDGVTREYMLEAALTGPADAAGVPVEQIPVHDVYDDEVNGQPAQTVIYGANLNGLKFVFCNSIVVMETATLQVITYEVGTEFTEAHAKFHTEFVRLTRIAPEPEPVR